MACRALKGEPLPRPVTHRRQLIAPSGTIDRSQLLAERSVLDASPDAISEILQCSLLPVEPLPPPIWTATLNPDVMVRTGRGTRAPPKKTLIEAARAGQKNVDGALMQSASDSDLFHPVERNLLASSVIQLRGARRDVVGNRLSVLEQAVVLQVGGDPCRPERVIADSGGDAGVCRTALNHTAGILLPHRLPSTGLPPGGAAQRPAYPVGESRPRFQQTVGAFSV
ncbi:MAG: hypothetical protein ACREFJ_08610 [Acetobacteraceae bacterium]